jgi:hypothetical protein
MYYYYASAALYAAGTLRADLGDSVVTSDTLEATLGTACLPKARVAPVPESEVIYSFLCQRMDDRMDELMRLAETDPIRAKVRIKNFGRWLRVVKPSSASENVHLGCIRELVAELVHRLRKK